MRYSCDGRDMEVRWVEGNDEILVVEGEIWRQEMGGNNEILMGMGSDMEASYWKK